MLCGPVVAWGPVPPAFPSMGGGRAVVFGELYSTHRSIQMFAGTQPLPTSQTFLKVRIPWDSG